MQVITTKKFLSHGGYPFFAVPGNHYKPKIWNSAKIFEGAVFFWTIPTVFLGSIIFKHSFTLDFSTEHWLPLVFDMFQTSTKSMKNLASIRSVGII